MDAMVLNGGDMRPCCANARLCSTTVGGGWQNPTGGLLGSPQMGMGWIMDEQAEKRLRYVRNTGVIVCSGFLLAVGVGVCAVVFHKPALIAVSAVVGFAALFVLVARSAIGGRL